MKTILVPIDFSETATNAVYYAANLAQYTKSKLVLFHAYHVPMIVSEVPFVLTSEDIQLEEKSNEQMKLIVDVLQKQYENNLEIETLSFQGFASDEIVELAKEKKCDLIVMGTKGAGKSSTFLGSNTVDVLKHTTCHVLIVPDKIEFREIDKILFAFDFKSIQNNSVLDPLIELATLFNAEIMIFNIEDSRIQPSIDKSLEGIKIDHVLAKVKHTYWFSEHKNLVDAINDFAYSKHAILITMIRRSHNLIQQILTKSNTKLMALHSQIPLLVLHEQADK